MCTNNAHPKSQSDLIFPTSQMLKNLPHFHEFFLSINDFSYFVYLSMQKQSNRI